MSFLIEPIVDNLHLDKSFESKFVVAEISTYKAEEGLKIYIIWDEKCILEVVSTI